MMESTSWRLSFQRRMRGEESSTTDSQLLNRNQDTIAEVVYDDPVASEAIEACDARAGEKLDPQEVRKGRDKEVQELDEFEVKMEVDESELRAMPGKKIWSKVGVDAQGSNQFGRAMSVVRHRSRQADPDLARLRRPPLKFVRLILSWEASYKPKRTRKPKSNAATIIAVFDISVSFFHGKVRKTI